MSNMESEPTGRQLLTLSLFSLRADPTGQRMRPPNERGRYTACLEVMGKNTLIQGKRMLDGFLRLRCFYLNQPYYLKRELEPLPHGTEMMAAIANQKVVHSNNASVVTFTGGILGSLQSERSQNYMLMNNISIAHTDEI